MDCKPVKIVAADQIRRVPAGYFKFDDFNAFCRQVRELFHTEFPGLETSAGRFALQYTDDEGDAIVVKCDAELKASQMSQDGHVLRFSIVENAGLAAPPVASPATTAAATQEDRSEATMYAALDSSAINSIALLHMDNNDLDKAREAFHAGLKRFPRSTILYYNLACVESQAGNIPDAVECMRSALMFGYRNVDNILLDDDLVNMRASEDFRELLREFTEAYQTPVARSPVAAFDSPAPETLERSPSADAEDVISVEEDTESSRCDDDSFNTQSDLNFEESIRSAPVQLEASAPAGPVDAYEQTEDESEDVPPPLETARYPFIEQLGQLEVLGFQTGLSMRILTKHAGDVNKAIDELLGM
jgi:tetratricopeptide (TPR) repeat protein